MQEASNAEEEGGPTLLPLGAKKVPSLDGLPTLTIPVKRGGVTNKKITNAREYFDQFGREEDDASQVVLTNRKDLKGQFQYTMDKIDNDEIDFEKDLGDL